MGLGSQAVALMAALLAIESGVLRDKLRLAERTSGGRARGVKSLVLSLGVLPGHADFKVLRLSRQRLVALHSLEERLGCQGQCQVFHISIGIGLSIRKLACALWSMLIRPRHARTLEVDRTTLDILSWGALSCLDLRLRLDLGSLVLFQYRLSCIESLSLANVEASHQASLFLQHL